MSKKRLIRSTTVLSVRRNGQVVLAGDGQVTLGESVIKHTAKKIRRLYRTRSWRGSLVPPLMHFHYSVASNLSLSSITAIWAGQPSNLPKIGVQTSFCAIWRPCFWFPTGNKRFYSVGRET